MRKTKTILVTSWLMLSLMALASARLLRADDEKPAPAPLQLKPGDMAPDFKLQYVDASGEKEISLSQYRGKKNVVLAFYIFAFTGG
jgi:AhpC/TSA family